MLDTQEVCSHWSMIVFACLWFITFSMLVVCVRHVQLPISYYHGEKNTERDT